MSFTIALLYCWSVLPWSRHCGAVGASSAPCLLASSVKGTCRALVFPRKANERARQVRHRKHLKKLVRSATWPSYRVVVLGLLVAWACCRLGSCRCRRSLHCRRLLC